MDAKQADGNMYVADILEYNTDFLVNMLVGGMSLFACMMRTLDKKLWKSRGTGKV